MAKRPMFSSPEVTKAAAKKLLPLINNCLEKNDDSLLSEIEKAISSDNDGYSIACNLHYQCSVSLDTEIINIFDDNTLYFKNNCLYELTRQWVADNNITQSRNVGDAVIYNGDKAIIKYITEDGKYVLFCPALGHVERGDGITGIFINWENVSDEQ